jgi:DNA modification methylase
MQDLAEFRISRMKIPESLDIDLIDMGERGRTTYNRVEELAQSISDNGLIQPIVLVPLDSFTDEEGNIAYHYGLDAGGRRLAALKHLGVTRLWHATTCDPDRPGFVLKGEDQSTPLKRLYTEIAENLDRENLDWRDEMKLLNKAWMLARTEADANGEKLLMRDFGAMLGTGYAHLQAATAIYTDVVAHPDRYKDCTSIRGAYSILLKVNADELHKVQTSRSIQAVPLLTRTEVKLEEKIVSAQDEPERINIPITNAFFNMNGIEWLKSLGYNTIDHVITDPDYGVSLERLEASIGGAAQGVYHETIEHSLSDLYQIIKESWRVMKPQGFLVFWYDLDHHEKLQRFATEVGFAVQRWPLIWHKTDYRSNSAPAYNFTKNIEYAMICRKPNAVLARAQTSCVYGCAAGPIVKELGHPFAKPYELWQWIYSAVAIKGQTIADPCVGRGSSSIAAIRWGLRPVGAEIDPDHYNGLVFNLQLAYKRELGNNVTFS